LQRAFGDKKEENILKGDPKLVKREGNNLGVPNALVGVL